MLTQINTNIVVMVLDLIHVHNFHGQTGAGIKILLFLVLMWAHLSMFILNGILVLGEDILVLGEGPTQSLDDIILTAEAKYPINFTESGKILY